MTLKIPISLIIHTRDSAATLPRLLETTQWADERIVVDMQSSDATRDMAEKAGCQVHSTPVVNAVDSIRNQFLPMARNAWVLVMDSDEYLAADAHESLLQLIDKHGDAADAFAIPRFNSVAGQVLRSSGFYPDHQIRFFRKGSVAWQVGHHRVPQVLTGADRLHLIKPPHCLHIHHENYTDIASLIRRQVHYALTDTYDDNPDNFDFNAYIAEAYGEFERRHDPSKDGDLSTAVATVLAWDRIMRGLLHWERLGRRHPLNEAFSLPIMTTIAARRVRKKPMDRLRRFHQRVKKTLRGLRHGIRQKFRRADNP